LIEYENQQDAEDIIRDNDDTQFMGQKIRVGWAFSKGPLKRSSVKYDSSLCCSSLLPLTKTLKSVFWLMNWWTAVELQSVF